MGSAVEDALARASAEQREKAQAVIEEARRNIRLVSAQQMEDISPTSADSIARNAQIIEEAKRTIPGETMQDVTEITPPLNTPSGRPANSKVIYLDEHVQSRIENIQQGDGNNYLRENAVDRALERPSQDIQREGQQREMSR